MPRKGEPRFWEIGSKAETFIGAKVADLVANEVEAFRDQYCKELQIKLWSTEDDCSLSLFDENGAGEFVASFDILELPYLIESEQDRQALINKLQALIERVRTLPLN